MTRPGDDERLPLSRTPSVDDDVGKEIAFHLAERAKEFEGRGASPERALAMARESFGDSAAVAAECKTIERRRRSSAQRSDKLAAFTQDLRVGLRMLRKSPGFSIAAVLTLALGIGATAAVFSIVNRIILQPLPYQDAHRLFTVVERHANGGWGNIPWATLLDLRKEAKSFEAIASYSSGTTTVLTSAGPMRVQAGFVSADFFRVFPVRPERGRLPREDEHVHGATPVAVVSHAFWRDALGAPESLEGIRVKLGFDHEVIGVLPASFDFPDGNQVWRPIELLDHSQSRTSHNWPVIGRLRADVSRITAERELDAILARLRPLHYPDFDALGSTVTLFQDSISGPLKTPLYLLLGASAVLLLAACTNLASAMLARGTARVSEFALRSALGATRTRLIRQLLTESAVLALVGCVAGLVLAVVIIRALGPLAPANLHMERVHVDRWVQGFALTIAVATTALFGLFPALRLSEANTTLALREGGGSGGGGTAGARRMRAWHGLVAAEVALAVTLFAGSTLLIRSFANVMATDVGFNPDGAIAVSVDLPAINYDNQSLRVATFHERAFESISRIQGVSAAGLVNVLPLAGSQPNGAMEVEGKPHNPRGPFTGFSVYRVVSRGYFDAVGTRILKGRDFNAGDDGRAAPVVIVNRAFADREWPGQDAIGRRVRPAGMDGLTEPWFTVIGVVEDSRLNTVTSPYAPVYFFDHRQRPPNRARSITYVVRTSAARDAIVPAIREAIRDVDPQVPMAFQNLDFVVANSVATRRFTMTVLGTFAGAALLLAGIGIYAVVAYAVAQRTREIGVRRALGATPWGVRRMVVMSSMRAVVPGLVVGSGLALAAGHALRSLLYGVSPFDATALVIAVVVLGASAIIASVIPALRATRIDPMVAMRVD
jgi:putative ABC transport system permease protein